MPQATAFENLIGEDRAKELVKARYLVSSKAQARTISDYDKWFRMYKNERVDSNYKGFSNIVVPKVFEKVERGTSLLSQAIKKVKVLGQGQEDQSSAQFNEKLIEFEERVLGIPKLRKLWIKSARIHGEAFLKCTWDVSKETPTEPYKGISVSLCDPKSIFYNPDHTTDQTFRWVIHEVKVPFSEIKSNKSYKKELVQRVKETSQLGGKRQSSNTISNRQLDTRDETTLMVNLKEYFGPFAKTDNDDEKSYRILLANDEVVLKSAPNPYAEILDDPIPIFPLYIYNTPHESHAMGDAEAIASLYTELNDTRNQRLDTVTLNIDPMKLVLKAAQIDEKDLVAKKGWIVHSNIPGGVTVVPPDMQGVVAAINEEKIIQGDIDRTLGIPSFGSQTPVSGDITTDTATGVNATLQAQDVISNSLLEEVKNALTKFYRAILAYNQVFIDREFKMILISDAKPESLVVNPQHLKGNVDLDIEVELVGNRLARRAEALAALSVGTKIPGTNMGKLWEDYLKTHDKYDFQEYYQAPQPVPPEPPKVSISLKGDLTQLQSSQVYQTIPGVNPVYADPIMTPEGRNMMRGELPEYNDKQDREMGLMEKVQGMKNNAQQGTAE